MSDYLAIVDGSAMTLYTLEGGEARQVAALNLTETTPSTVATIVQGLRPYLNARRVSEQQMHRPQGYEAAVKATAGKASAASRGRPRGTTTGENQHVYDWAFAQTEPFTAADMRRALRLTEKESSNRITYLKHKGLVATIDMIPNPDSQVGGMVAVYRSTKKAEQ